MIRDFIASLGNRANLALPHITPKDVLTYHNSIIKTNKTARTANLSVKVVSVAFNAALRQGYIQTNPATAVESLPVKAQERGTFTSAQVSKLVRAAGGDWRSAILLGYYTGARLGDVANMRWDAIDWRSKVVRFTPSKTKKPVTIPLHRDLERELLKNAGIGKTPMFPSLAGKDTGGKHGLSGRFAVIMEKAKIKANRRKQVAGEPYRASVFTACGTRSIAQWQTPVYRKKCGRNSPDTHRQKRTRFTRITSLNSCVRRSQ